MDFTSTKKTGLLFILAAWGVIAIGALYSASVRLPGAPAGSVTGALEVARLTASGPLPFLLMAAAGLSLSILLVTSRSARARGRPLGKRGVSEIVQSLDAIVWVADAVTLRALFVSQGVEPILGYAFQPWLAGWDFLREHIHPDDRRDVMGRIRTCAERGRGLRIEYRALDADENVVWLRNTVTVVDDADGRPWRLHGVIVDVTESRRREESLQQQTQLQEAMIAHSPAAMAFLDSELTLVRVNPCFAQALGRPSAELEGSDGLAVVSDPEVKAALQGVRVTGRPAVVRAKPLPAPGEPEGPATYWDWHVRAVRGPQGGPEGLMLSLVEVTSAERGRRAAEQQAAALQEAGADKDRFLAVVAHELRNPLASALSGLDALHLALPADGQLQHALETIRRSMRLQARLVDDLAQFAALRAEAFPMEQEPVALDAVVAAAIDAMRAEAERASLGLHAETTPGLWVRGDADRLHQAVSNLLANAVKYTPPGGEVRVRLYRCEEETRAGRPEAEAGHATTAVSPTSPVPGPPSPVSRWGCIAVEDTGMGISPELVPHLFEMFSQGPPPRQGRQGLGIGLALVKSIVGRHGGRVWAESAGLGEGSRFTIALPLIPPPP